MVASANWFRNASVYQIYPRSFNDSNGDGIGDLRGIINKLDYLRDLGVDAVWLCPIYASPNDDNGYDISDYQAIHPDFGTMADFDELLAGLHQRGIKLILDMVLNHCSDEHPWFVSAKSDRNSPYRDWFHWQPAATDGSAPNAWGSFFSGSTWEPVLAADGQTDYYLHLFSKKQPDLNWENPRVRQALYAMMNWWLDKGVDGLRLDVINLVSKKSGYPEGEAVPGSAFTSAFHQCANGPRIHEFMQEMNQAVFAPHGAVTVGETPGVSVAHAQAYTDPLRQELSMVFQFELMELDSGPLGKFDPVPVSAQAIQAVCQRWQEGLVARGWNSLYWNNHDQPRPISRFGSPEKYRELSGMALAAYLYLQRGTVFIYQGEEIGMLNLPWQDASELRDIEAHNFIREAAQLPEWTPDKIWNGLLAKGRDNARSPMCWNGGRSAGFSDNLPWLRVHPEYERINVAESRARPDSLWHFYRRLIELRRNLALVGDGRIEFAASPHPQLLAYRRYNASGRELWVAVNWGDAPVLLADQADLSSWPVWATFANQAESLLANYPDQSVAAQWRPWELRVWLSLE